MARGKAAKLDGTTVDAGIIQDRPLFSQTIPPLQELIVCLLYVSLNYNGSAPKHRTDLVSYLRDPFTVVCQGRVLACSKSVGIL
jgi:hypothetical protein